MASTELLASTLMIDKGPVACAGSTWRFRLACRTRRAGWPSFASTLRSCRSWALSLPPSTSPASPQTLRGANTSGNKHART
eukprot:1179112-Prorocentrum_minimum.AAC.1